MQKNVSKDAALFAIKIFGGGLIAAQFHITAFRVIPNQLISFRFPFLLPGAKLRRIVFVFQRIVVFVGQQVVALPKKRVQLCRQRFFSFISPSRKSDSSQRRQYSSASDFSRFDR